MSIKERKSENDYVIEFRQKVKDEDMEEIIKLYIETMYYRYKEMPIDFQLNGLELNKKITREELVRKYEEMKEQVYKDKKNKRMKEKQLLEMIRLILYEPEEANRVAQIQVSDEYYEEWKKVEEKIKRGEYEEGTYLLKQGDKIGRRKEIE